MSEYREGQTATNPKTGQRVVYKGGQWVNAGSVAPIAAASGGGMFGGKAAQLARNKLMAAAGLERQLSTLQSYYDKDFKGIGPGSLLEYLPTQAADRFNSAASAIERAT